MTSGASSFGTLFQGNAFFSAVQKKDTIVFFTGIGAEKTNSISMIPITKRGQ